MAQSDKPTGSGFRGPRSAESVLRDVTQDLQNLQDSLITQLNEDVVWLKAEKSRLIQEIDQLRQQSEALKSHRDDLQTQQHLAQQQQWAKQLAQALAVHLQALMSQKLDQMAESSTANRLAPAATPPPPLANGHTDHAYQVLASLDATLTSTFRTLQQDLSSYESSLTQQLNRIHSMEKQGEVILSALITRLSEQLQQEIAKTATPEVVRPFPGFAGYGQSAATDHYGYQQDAAGDRWPQDLNGNGSKGTLVGERPLPPSYPPPPPPPATPAPAAPKKSSFAQIGFILVLLSSFALSFHNVVVQILFKERMVFGSMPMGGFITPGFGTSVLILWLRMVIVLPMMAILAGFLYPPIWKDIRTAITSSDRDPLKNMIFSGFLLFLSQVLIYAALGQIPVGIAVSIFFIYPVVTVFLAWKQFGDRPTPFRLMVMLVICLGAALTLNWQAKASGNFLWGCIAAGLSGLAFAGYVLVTGLSTRKFNPVPVTLMQFFTILVLSSVMMVFPLSDQFRPVPPSNWAGFGIGCLVLGAATLLGYLFNNFGIRLIGPGPASIIGATGPAFSAVLAALMIAQTLQPLQWWGVALVTLGAVGINLERVLGWSKPPAPQK